MRITKPEDFYAACAEERTYAAPIAKAKHLRQYDAQFWRPAACRPEMSVLELGCGSGLFLAYLKRKGVRDVIGVDAEARVLDAMPADLARHVHITTLGAYLDANAEKTFDRIAMFDVLEHFSPSEGVALLERLRKHLAPGGRVVVRVPNASSPWGLRHQFGDLTHKAAYTPDSLRQLAIAAGFDVVACLPVRPSRIVKRAARRAREWLAARLFGEGPEIWSAVFVAVLRPR